MPLKKTVNGYEEMTVEEIEEQSQSLLAWQNVSNRNKRNQLLADSDWTQMNDSPLANEAKTAWATYRTALRDLTTHENWPNLNDDDWPSI